MPLSGTYSWTETENHVEILIPLKRVSPKKVDVFTASTILKVSYVPYLVDLNLFAEIDNGKSRAILEGGTLKIRLEKKEGHRELWGQLCFEGTDDEVKLRRQKALDERKNEVQQHIENVATKKVQEERMVFRQHMALEQKELQRMDDIKRQEKLRAEKAVHDTFSGLRGQRSSPERDTNDSMPISNSPQDMSVSRVRVKEAGRSTVKDEENCNVVIGSDLPPPRPMIRTTFRHTPRVFKTPSRESTAKQEQEFIMKKRSQLKQNALLNADNIGDVDPAWLRAKGDEFRNAGDFRSAINAYSDALEADATMLDVLSGRAACYLRLRESSRCIEDCTRLLELSRHRACGNRFEKETRVRLGMSLCLDGEYVEGMRWFEEARELETDSAVEECIAYLEVLMRANASKVEGDRLFAEGEFGEAYERYTEAIEIDPEYVNAVINRTACTLAMRNAPDCIEECTRALRMMEGGRANVLARLLSPDLRGRRRWIATLLYRRAAARRMNGNDDVESLADLEEAFKIARREDGVDVDALEGEIASLRVGVGSIGVGMDRPRPFGTV